MVQLCWEIISMNEVEWNKKALRDVKKLSRRNQKGAWLFNIQASDWRKT